MDTFVVIGPPRTGTSLVAGILHRSGIWMGDILNPPAGTNESGFFEDFTFIDTNESILLRLDAEWCKPPDMSCFVDTLKDWYDGRVDALIASKMRRAQESGRDAWGFKDQRAVLLWPLYLNSLLMAGAQLIVMHRNPLSVARSLVRAWPDDVGDVRAGLELWASYALLIEDWLRHWPEERPVLRISFEDLFTDTEYQLQRLEMFTGRVMVRGIVDQKLRHF